jgi:hypothetical protein
MGLNLERRVFRQAGMSIVQPRLFLHKECDTALPARLDCRQWGARRCNVDAGILVSANRAT